MHRAVQFLFLVLVTRLPSGLGDSSCKQEVTCEDLDVKYAGTAVSCDSAKAPSEVSSAPDVFYNGGQNTDGFLLMMVDPDAPSRDRAPKCGYWLHWMRRVTVDQNSNKQLQPTEGGELMEYAGPTPPAGSGYHRYQFLLYSLPSTADVTGVPESRGNFSLAEFVSANSLSGKQVAGFQFKAKN